MLRRRGQQRGRLGILPLPPYIERADDDPRRANDNERYQTVYAKTSRPVAAAAPLSNSAFS